MINKKMMSTMAVLGMMLTGGTIVNAQTRTAPSDGTTPVTYDNRTVLPDGNAQYGMVIPTSISFSDDSKTADATLEIVGINGYYLDKDWTELGVTVKIASQNGYKLKKDSKEVSYKLKMDNNDSDFDSGMDEKEVTKKFGVGGSDGKVKKETGTATLTGKATEKGQYSDTLTYKFTETVNNQK
ncbi:hypothetical protein [Enterococcus pernyi]|uniref:hypothetical protein n=1 Tax=Enterococcus pernyi TaxID=590158 RepID=UPI000789AB64|nr:hypothetical protein [Enterococcus pernyi]